MVPEGGKRARSSTPTRASRSRSSRPPRTRCRSACPRSARRRRRRSSSTSRPERSSPRRPSRAGARPAGSRSGATAPRRSRCPSDAAEDRRADRAQRQRPRRPAATRSSTATARARAPRSRPTTPGSCTSAATTTRRPARPRRPALRNVDLLAGTCENGYFTATAAADPCTVNVAAVIDFGATPPPLDTTRIPRCARRQREHRRRPHAAGHERRCLDRRRRSPSTAASRSVSIDLRWQTGCPRTPLAPATDQPHEGRFGRSIARSRARVLTVSGPIKSLTLFENAVSPANSFPALRPRARTTSSSRSGSSPACSPPRASATRWSRSRSPAAAARTRRWTATPTSRTSARSWPTGCGPTLHRQRRRAACPAGAPNLWAARSPGSASRSTPARRSAR